MLDELFDGKARLRAVGDERTNVVVLTGSPAVLAEAAVVVDRMDRPAEQTAPVVGAPPVLKTFTLKAAHAADVTRMLEKVFLGKSVRVPQLGDNRIRVYGPPDDLKETARILSAIEEDDSGKAPR